MSVRRSKSALALFGLTVAALACSLPAPAPAGLTPTVYVPPEPSVPPQEASPAPELTQEPSPTSDPMPEGVLRVVYTGGGGLWIVDGEEPARQLTASQASGSPSFSPDGRWVLFRRELPPGEANLPRYELAVIGVDGGGERRVVDPDDLPGEMGAPIDSDTDVLLDRLPLQIAWLPDSHTIAFNTIIEGGYGLTTNDDLWLVDLESGTLTQLLRDGEGGAFAFSPDGSHLVVSTSSRVTMMDADGSNPRVMVTFEFVNTASEYAYQPMPVWAPAGSHALVAISSPQPFGPEVASGNIWRLPVDGDATLLATLPGQFLFNTMNGDLWSPDRTRIAYTVPIGEANSNTHDLIIADVDGDDPIVYASGELEFLSWAPRGDRFAFRYNQPSEVYLGRVGLPPAQLLAPLEGIERIASLRWADEETLVYVVVGTDTFAIWGGQVDVGYRIIATSSGSFPQLDAHR